MNHLVFHLFPRKKHLFIYLLCKIIENIKLMIIKINQSKSLQHLRLSANGEQRCRTTIQQYTRGTKARRRKMSQRKRRTQQIHAISHGKKLKIKGQGSNYPPSTLRSILYIFSRGIHWYRFWFWFWLSGASFAFVTALTSQDFTFLCYLEHLTSG